MAPKKQKKSEDVPVISDSRFSDMHSAPTFKRMKIEKHKVTVDPRFAKALNSDAFKVSEGKIDKYGRKQKKTEAKEELSSFYNIEDDNDYDDDEEELALAEAEIEANKESSSTGKKLKAKPKQIKRQKFKPGEKLPTDEVEKRLAHLNRMARGELDSEDDSDSSDSSSESSEEEEELVKSSREEFRQTEVLPEGGETKRLAVCNLDWDHLGANDILKLMESFVPAGGAILGVSVYPSDYGLERIEEENRFGPRISSRKNQESESESDSESEEVLGVLEGGDGGERKQVGLVYADSDSDSDLSDMEGLPMPVFGAKRKGKATVAKGYGKTLDYDEEELRAYEIQRSKYYFAIVVCDTVATASALYDKVNLMEWEYSSTTVDLSFVPDELDLTERQCKETTTKVPEGYQAPEFVSSARQQSKVTCTWDEDDPNRSRELNRLNDWKNIGDSEDISHLVAMDSGSEDEEAQDKSKMRALMGFGDSDSEVSESEFNDLKGGESDEAEEYNFVDPAKENALRDALAGRKKGNKEETPWEKTQRKLAEKKKAKKESRKAKLSGQSQDKDAPGSEEDVPDENFFITSDDDTPAAKTKTPLLNATDNFSDNDDEDDAEDARNYDMRAVVRAEKMKGKKLKGVRAKKEAKRQANSATVQIVDEGSFKPDVKDPRFSAMLDGDSRFGLDPTSSSFKKTDGMKALLDEQKRRRKENNNKDKVELNSNEVKSAPEDGMSSLVSSLKNRSLKMEKTKKPQKK